MSFKTAILVGMVSVSLGAYGLGSSGKKTDNKTCEKNARFDDLTVDTANLPTSFDWRTKLGQVPPPPVGDQAHDASGHKVGCGSCWTFGTTGVLEFLEAIHNQRSVALSQEQLLTCAYADNGVNGCQGGSMCVAADYQKQFGQALAAADPYTGKPTACDTSLKPVSRLSDYAFIGPRNGAPTTAQLKQAIVTYGPIMVDVDDNQTFSQYKGGIFGLKAKECARGKDNHVVALVGFGNDGQGHDYFILRNSFGADWGEQGYMRIVPGCSGLAKKAMYTVVEPANQ